MDWRISLLVITYSVFILLAVIKLILIHKNINKHSWVINLLLVIALICAVTFSGAISLNYHNEKIYNQGIECIQNGDYISAVKILSEIRYSDSDEILEEIYEPYRYQLGLEYEETGDWVRAMECFIDSYYYSNAKEHLKYCSEEFIKTIEEIK